MRGLKMSLNDLIKSISKQYGDGSIFKMDGKTVTKVEGISTGLYSLDEAIGGCIPFGRIIELYGSESSGKTTLSLNIIAQAQKEGYNVAFIDAEHALNIEWAKTLGVNVDNLLISQPDSGEQALDIVETLVKSGEIRVIVVDSVSALTPMAELEGEMGDAHIGLQARLMSQAMRKLHSCLNKYKVSLIFINQIRMKIGVMFGSPETTSGGRALKFFSSLRIDMRRVSNIKTKEDTTGIHIRARVVKNKIAPPFKESEFDVYFATGIDFIGDLIDVSVKNGIIDRNGSWFSYGKVKLGQGKENACKTLMENEALLKEIKEKNGTL
jgi:recombination protein RecA